MILKKIFEKYNIPVEPILMKEYKRLKLTKDEVWTLITLFSSVQKKESFKIDSIAERLEYDKEKVDKILDSLYKKGFYDIKTDLNKDGKEIQVINLDKGLKKLEDLINEDVKDENIIKKQTDLEYLISEFEKILARNLSYIELELIKDSFNNKINRQLIDKTLNKIRNFSKPSVEYYIKLINKNNEKKVNLDEKDKEDIKKIFDAIK